MSRDSNIGPGSILEGLTTMYVRDDGREDGDTIVLLHASMVAGWMWTEQVAALSDDYRVIVPDLPGIGASASDGWTDFARTADAVAVEIAARASGGAHVVGLSLGGIIALNLAVSSPEVCKSLLVSGVPAGSMSAPLRLLNRTIAALYGTTFGARLIGRSFGLPDEESMAAFVATAKSTDRATVQEIATEASSKPLPDGLSGVSMPVLAVVGERDTAAPRRGVPRLVETIPGSCGALVPGVGHQWNVEAPEMFSEMVRLWVENERLHPDLVEVDHLG